MRGELARKGPEPHGSPSGSMGLNCALDSGAGRAFGPRPGTAWEVCCHVASGRGSHLILCETGLLKTNVPPAASYFANRMPRTQIHRSYVEKRAFGAETARISTLSPTTS
jgi:hypothetical protein